MSEPTGGLRIVTDGASGWCDPDTGVCHIDVAGEAGTETTDDENSAGDAPDTTQG